MLILNKWITSMQESSIQMAFDPQFTPKPIKGPLAEKTVTRITCGQQHSIAIDNEGGCWTWGNGGYGRLGHKVQKDELLPKKIEATFTGRVNVPAGSIIAGGGNASFSNSNIGMHYWGKTKANGDNQMTPCEFTLCVSMSLARSIDCIRLTNRCLIPTTAVFMDLSGWNMRAMACGPAHFVVAADNSTITWGQATNGELGYGPNKKSSANPAKCEAAEGLPMIQVAAGAGFSLFLAPNASDADKAKLEKFQVFESTAPEESAAEAGGKRKGEPAAAGKGKKAK